jgi:hypothetical protein
MKLEDLRSHLFNGGSVRQADWTQEVQLRWNWAKGWEVSSDEGKTWEQTSLLPNPLYMFTSNWEAV